MGIGDWVDKYELMAIASYPKQLIEVANYASLANYVTRTQDLICGSECERRIYFSFSFFFFLFSLLNYNLLFCFDFIFILFLLCVFFFFFFLANICFPFY